MERNEHMENNTEHPAPEENFEALLNEEGASSLKEVKVGDRVRGRIVSVEEGDAFVDYGGRSEATIAASELRDDDGSERYKVGDEIEAIVAAADDGVLLTLSGRSTVLSGEMLREAFQTRIPVEGLVESINKGGFEVKVSGLRGFCPLSQIDSKYCETPSEFLGQKLSFRIIEWKDGGRSLVLSRRAVLEEQERQRREEVRAKIVEGAELDGVVKRIQSFGLFVDLGGVEGLVHVSEISHGRIDNPAQHFSADQKVRVKVLKVENLGQSNERISLSIRALLPDPWELEASRFHQGSVVRGRVVGLTNFGAFVELAPGLDGLIHLSALSRRRIAHASEVVSEGTEVEVEILEIDTDRRRIALSLKKPGEPTDAESAAAVTVGETVDCVVKNTKPYGVFVEFAKSDLRLSGLIPISETGEPRGANLNKRFPRGRRLQAEVIEVNDEGRIRLSMNMLRERREREGYETYKADRQPRRAGTSLSMFADVLEKVKRRAEDSPD